MTQISCLSSTGLAPTLGIWWMLHSCRSHSVVLSVSIFHTYLFRIIKFIHWFPGCCIPGILWKSSWRNAKPKIRLVVNRFSLLREVKKYVNTLQDLEQGTEFSFSCQDTLNICQPGMNAYVMTPERNVVNLCPSFFEKEPLSSMCSTPYYLPSNPAVNFQGAYITVHVLRL